MFRKEIFCFLVIKETQKIINNIFFCIYKVWPKTARKKSMQSFRGRRGHSMSSWTNCFTFQVAVLSLGLRNHQRGPADLWRPLTPLKLSIRHFLTILVLDVIINCFSIVHCSFKQLIIKWFWIIFIYFWFVIWYHSGQWKAHLFY